MKYILKTIWFLQAFAARLIPMILFFIVHAVGEVYVYSWDPLEFLNILGIPAMFGSYLFLYGALGLIILVLFFMELPIIARTMTLGILLAQLVFFLQRWNNYIHDVREVDPYYNFYMLILASIIVGFILQVLWKSILALIKLQRYRYSQRKSTPPRKATAKNRTQKN